MKKNNVSKRSRILKIIAFILVLVVFIAIGSFFVYTSIYYKAQGDIDAILNSTTLTVRQEKGFIGLQPVDSKPTVGYIFYPGGKVEETAYLSAMADIANHGYVAAVIKAPFRLAIFDTGAALAVQQAYPDVSYWVVGGHSLGGVAAAMFTQDHPETVQGLVLLASYSTVDLSHKTIPTLSISATNDAVLNWENYSNKQTNLPLTTQFISIDGGNHGQFGDYGPQKGDGKASITQQQQQQLIVEHTLLLLESIAPSNQANAA